MSLIHSISDDSKDETKIYLIYKEKSVHTMLFSNQLLKFYNETKVLKEFYLILEEGFELEGQSWNITNKLDMEVIDWTFGEIPNNCEKDLDEIAIISAGKDDEK